MKRRAVVVALGGNALAPAAENVTVYDQFRHTRESLGSVVELAQADFAIAVVHGNGPQVGDALLRNELASHALPELPLGVLVAATGGWIGYMIQQSLQNALTRAGVRRSVVTLMTQAVVDPDDPASREPTKFIGRPLAPERADRLRADGWVVSEDRAGHLRRVVPSPPPLDIVEKDTVRDLVRAGVIVVAAGGGAIPVFRHPRFGLEGLDVVIDKDRAAAMLAREIQAEVLLILTDVDALYRDFGTTRSDAVRRATLSEAEAMLEGGQLERGTMRPKVEAAVSFLRGGGERALIARLDQGREALDGAAGTEFVG